MMRCRDAMEARLQMRFIDGLLRALRRSGSMIRDEVSLMSARAHALSNRRCTSSASLDRCCASRLLRESEERPPVLAEPLQVFAVDRFGVGGSTRLEQDRAENLPRRMMPDRRLVVGNAVLDRHGLAKRRNRCVSVAPPQH